MPHGTPEPQVGLPLPGVILFCAPRKVLCYDDRAEDLLSKKSATARRQRQTAFAIPPGIYRCCAEVLSKMRSHAQIRDCKDFKITRMLRHNAVNLIVGAIGLPQPRGKAGPLVLVLIATLDDQAAQLSHRAMELLGFSRHEQAVLQYLLNGWTNAEIAQALDIPEESIKKHLRRIMERTHTWSRTAVIKALLRTLGVSPA